MKNVKRAGVKVITAATGSEFETRINEALSGLVNSSYSIHFNMSMGHCAYIEFSYTEQVPENLEDEYILRNDRYYCGNCPCFVPSFDGRSQYGECTYGMCKRPAPSNRACETFYINHHNGTWKERG